MELEVKLGKGCKATYEGRVKGKPGETVDAEILLTCERCGLREPLSAQGDVDTVVSKINSDGRAFLEFQSQSLEEPGIDPDDIPEGHFPTVRIVES